MDLNKPSSELYDDNDDTHDNSKSDIPLKETWR